MLHRGKRSLLIAGLGLFLFALLYHSTYSRKLVDTSREDNNPPMLSDVELVVASMKHENTSWVGKYFPSWRKSIYTVDDPTAPLTVPKNKGRETMAYLTYGYSPGLITYKNTELIHL